LFRRLSVFFISLRILECVGRREYDYFLYDYAYIFLLYLPSQPDLQIKILKIFGIWLQKWQKYQTSKICIHLALAKSKINFIRKSVFFVATNQDLAIL